MGQVALIGLDPYRPPDLAVAFAPDSVRSKQPGASLVIGGNLLCRFSTVYDYARRRMYVKAR